MSIALEGLAEMNKKKMTRTIYFHNALLLYCSWQLVKSGFRNWLYNRKAYKRDVDLDHGLLAWQI